MPVPKTTTTMHILILPNLSIQKSKITRSLVSNAKLFFKIDNIYDQQKNRCALAYQLQKWPKLEAFQ